MIIENFDDFYDHYQGFSAYVAFCITEDYELSKDISQEVFLALFKVKEKLDYSRPDKLKALVMKATSNKCMDYYRKASSRQESYTIDDEENAYEPVDEKSNPEARILRMGRREISETCTEQTSEEESDELRYSGQNKIPGTLSSRSGK